ncbi:D-Ala-D-Ala carboxypeptidase family metallohydrolase [Phenylobacterium sp.]|uniref:D-Ala-D-Ala carboxypeptidase family metallohydrolase n=1 Tax=Phenylobacterium sp. TaxID=1871053 RepID=UPI002715611A|nr:D-Ala-D-Ala carboxypeptidase family metallohydrolase [Phenylobacterium sp.]MDO8800028.1 D-Ala-D-Ala carboxypeptidase family metallohydrolase [Phenylobacterium sp.]
MTQLSPHFSLSEMTVTGTGLPNVAPSQAIASLTALCVNVLEPIRAHFGKPVQVNSGYRGPAVNRAVGSKPTSQHAKGEAADIEIPGVSNLALARWIAANLKFDQLIAEAVKANDPSAGWVHVSYGPRMRGQVLTMKGGKYTVGLAA